MSTVKELRFVEETHQYFFGDMELPSVTTILNEVGIIDTTWFKPEHAAKGQAIHRATELIDTGEIDWQSLDPVFYPYVDAWEQFKADYGFVILPQGIEIKSYHQKLMYAGTLDRDGLINDTPTIVDIKSGQKAKWHQLQLTAYREIKYSNKGLRSNLIAVYLKNTGKYKVEEYEAVPEDWSAILNYYRIKGKYA